MALIDLLLRSTLGNFKPPDLLTFGLFLGGKEVTDVGYRRAEIRKGSWMIRNDGTAEINVRFGPFAGTAEYDRAVLFSGSEVVEQILNVDGSSKVQQFTVIDYTFAPEFVRAPD